MGVVVCPEGVEVVEGRGEPGAEESHADRADEQAQDVQDAGGTPELGRRREDEHHDQHDGAGAELRAVADADAETLVVHRVDPVERGVELGLSVGGQECDVLKMRVEGSHGGGGADEAGWICLIGKMSRCWNGFGPSGPRWRERRLD